jgi:hypothetical protein
MHVADREVRAKPIEHQPIHRKDRIMRRGDFHRRRIGRIEHESGSFTRPALAATPALLRASKELSG